MHAPVPTDVHGITLVGAADTLTDEQRQQRVGSRALSPSELWPQTPRES